MNLYICILFKSTFYMFVYFYMFQTVTKFCLFFHLLKNKQVIINCHIKIISLSIVSNIKMAGVKVLVYCKTKPQKLKDGPVGKSN